MKAIRLLGVLSLLLTLLISCTPNKQDEATLSLLRNEENGFVNIVPVKIFIDGKLVGTVTAESTLKVKVLYGKHFLSLQYVDPYKENGGGNSICKFEKELTISQKALKLQIFPSVEDTSTYSGEWEWKYF